MHVKMFSMKVDPQQGFIHSSGLLAGVMSLAFVLSLGFGIWAFSGMQENKNNLDEKINTAVSVAVKEAESAKDVEFAEKQKSPFKKYTGSATYGSLSFEYPKTWSVYAEEKTSGVILDFYGQPGLIPGISKDVTFAFRAQILNSPYDTEVKKFNNDAKNGKVTVNAFRPEKLSAQLGVVVRGEVIKGKTGVLVLLPQRDKTFKIWTESSEYSGDFSKILSSLTYVP